MSRFNPPLDPGIEAYVIALCEGGVETFESCEGGPGHACPEPIVFFNGERAAGWRALHIVQEQGFPVLAVRRTWTVVDGEPLGPVWEMTFRAKCNSADDQA